MSRGNDRLPKPYRREGQISIFKIDVCEDTYKVLQHITKSPRIGDKEIQKIVGLVINLADTVLMHRVFAGDKDALNTLIRTMPIKS